MAIQSAVRCVETGPVEAGAVTSVRTETAHMDAIATFQALEQELARAPIGVVHKRDARTRFIRRACMALVCSGIAILIGGLMGTLSNF